MPWTAWLRSFTTSTTPHRQKRQGPHHPQEPSMHSDDAFQTIGTPGEGSYTEKRSRFLSFAMHVESEEEAK